ncbi:MAG: C10 family peptidase [Clostridium sp.]|nr:C10 family peptidase [Clostridium sp.]
MISKTKSILAALGLAAVAMPAFAAQLTPEQALSRALSGEGAPKSVRGLVEKNRLTLVHTLRDNSSATLYLFNNVGDGGFCVVAADDVVDTPLLGYSDSGAIDSENLPENLRYWLDEYSREIAWMIANPSEDRTLTTTVPAKAATARKDIAPMLTTKWNQDSPYNDLCPVISGKTTYTGCVATAMAQVMKYHNWPAKGTGSISYTTTTFRKSVSVNFANSTYDWDNMTDTYGRSSTAVQNAAVAKLMYDCGASVKMDYSYVASGALSSDIPGALTNYFGYDKTTIAQLYRSYYTIDEWTEILYNELADGRPFLFGGANNGGGHAFAIDGFRADGDYFHVNWGWSGMSDGYFRINALDPDAQGAGGTTAGYNSDQIATIGIQPASDPSATGIVPLIYATSEFKTAKTFYSRSASTSVMFFGDTYGGFYNFSLSKLAFNFGVKLVDQTSGEVSYVENPQLLTLDYGKGYAQYGIPSTNFPESGTYIMTPAYKVDNVWYDMRTMINLSNSVRMTSNGQTLTFTKIAKNMGGTISGLTLSSNTLYKNRPFQVSFTAKANAGEEFYESLYVYLYKSNTAVGILGTAQIDLLDGESEELTLTLMLPTTVATGTYSIYLFKRVGSQMVSQVSPIPVNVTVEAEPDISYKLSTVKFGGTSSTGRLPLSPAKVVWNDFSATTILTSQSGYFSEQMTGVFFDVKDQTMAAAQTSPVFAEVNEGESTEVTFEQDMSQQLEPNKTYMFVIWGEYVVGQMNNAQYVTGTVTGIEDITEALDELELYCNGGTLTVTAPAAIAGVTVYGFSGAEAVSASFGGIERQEQISVDGLARGIYIACVAMADGSVVSKRFVVR